MVSRPNQHVELSRFRYHTGAQPTPLTTDETCPVLFRDIGVDAMVRFLDADLQRLSGMLSPITYLRTANYVEPYTDHGRIGRVMVLAPRNIGVWHSGIDEVYIAPARNNGRCVPHVVIAC